MEKIQSKSNCNSSKLVKKCVDELQKLYPNGESFLVLNKSNSPMIMCKFVVPNPASTQYALMLFEPSYDGAKVVAGCNYLTLNDKPKNIKLVSIKVINSSNFNKGYGSMLLNFLEHDALQIKATEIAGICLAQSPLKECDVENFYAKNGYTLTKQAHSTLLCKTQQNFRTLTNFKKCDFNLNINDDMFTF